MRSPIRIGFVTDHPIFYEGATKAIEISANLIVVAKGRTVADAILIAKDATLNILLLEIEIPGMGIDAVRTICQTKPNARVIVLTALGDEGLVVDALEAGAQGYLLKDVTGAALRHAIESVHRGEPHITPILACRALSRLARPAMLFTSGKPVGLTAREQQVLRCMAQGLSNREIGLKLGIAVKTVKHHTVLLFAKLGVRNRVEATAVQYSANPSIVHAEGRLTH